MIVESISRYCSTATAGANPHVMNYCDNSGMPMRRDVFPPVTTTLESNVPTFTGSVKAFSVPEASNREHIMILTDNAVDIGKHGDDQETQSTDFDARPNPETTLRSLPDNAVGPTPITPNPKVSSTSPTTPPPGPNPNPSTWPARGQPFRTWTVTPDPLPSSSAPPPPPPPPSTRSNSRTWARHSIGREGGSTANQKRDDSLTTATPSLRYLNSVTSTPIPTTLITNIISSNPNPSPSQSQHPKHLFRRSILNKWGKSDHLHPLLTGTSFVRLGGVHWDCVKSTYTCTVFLSWIGVLCGIPLGALLWVLFKWYLRHRAAKKRDQVEKERQVARLVEKGKRMKMKAARERMDRGVRSAIAGMKKAKTKPGSNPTPRPVSVEGVEEVDRNVPWAHRT